MALLLRGRIGPNVVNLSIFRSRHFRITALYLKLYFFDIDIYL